MILFVLILFYFIKNEAIQDKMVHSVTKIDTFMGATFKFFFLPAICVSSLESMYLRRFWWKFLRP